MTGTFLRILSWSMAEVIPIVYVAAWEMAEREKESPGILNVEGYPTFWWRDDGGVHFWPKVPKWGLGGNANVIATVLYFENGDPAGFIVQ